MEDIKREVLENINKKTKTKEEQKNIDLTITKLLNSENDITKMSLLDYLAYTEDIKTLKLVAEYAEFDKKKPFSGLITLINAVNEEKCRDKEFLKVLNENYLKIFKNSLKKYKKNHLNDMKIGLFNAVINDNAWQINEILTRYPWLIYTKYASNKNILAIAIQYGRVNAFNTLIEKIGRDDVNIGNNFGWTFLMYASDNGDLEMFNKLVECGADINATNFIDGGSVLMCAVKSGRVNIVDRLIELGVELNILDKFDRTALIYAAQYNNVEIVRKLIRASADVNVVDSEGKNALEYAAMNNNFDMVRILAENIDVNDINSVNALFIAIQKGNAEITSYLIRKGVKLNNLKISDENKKRMHETIGRYLKPLTIEKKYSFINKSKTYSIEPAKPYMNFGCLLKMFKVNASPKLNSCIHDKNTPMKDFVEIGLGSNFITYDDLNEEEGRALNNVISRFDNGVKNRNQNEIKGSINDLLNLCRTSNEIYWLINSIIDQNVIYLDNGKSLTMLLNYYGFDTELFCISLRTNQILENAIEGIDLLNIRMNDETEMSIINKYFQMIYKINFGEEMNVLSKNENVNGACLLYQENGSEDNKNNLINVLVDNINMIDTENEEENENKHLLLETVLDYLNTSIINIGENKTASFEALFNGITNGDFGTCLKKRLEQEILMNNINENVFGRLNIVDGTMEDGRNKSIVNKIFELIYKKEPNNDTNALSQNLNINNACLMYQQDKTEENKQNLINAIINNTNHNQKETLFKWFNEYETYNFEVGVYGKKCSFSYLFQFLVDADFGLCLKNRLQKEVQLNVFKKLNNALDCRYCTKD